MTTHRQGLPGGLWTTEYYYLGGQPLSMWKGLAIPAVGAVPGCSTSAGHAMTGLALILLPFGLALVFWRRRAWRLCLVLLLSGGVVACAVMVSTCRPNDGPNGGVPYTFGGGYFYYHNDHRGAPLYMTDEDGKIVWLARYRPYGEIDEDRDVDRDGLPVENNLRYPGQYDDRLDELLLGDKLYYNMNRYYDPGMGRYISPEVEERLENIDTNNFTYAMSNPLSYIDRNALDPFGGDGEADMWRQVLGLATNDEIVREQTYSGIGAFIGLGILGSLELAPYAIMAGSSLWQRLSSIWQNIFSNPCKTVAGRSLSDVLSTQNVEIFKSFIRRISGEAMKAGGATRTLADTYRILQRAKELGYEVVTGIETKWAGGPHIHLQYPGSGKIYFPVPPGFEL